MLSKNLIVAGILAANLASADVPLSMQHDTTYSVAESVGIASARNLRAITDQIPLGSTAKASQCDNIGSATQLANGGDLLSLGLVASILGGPNDIQTCCNACVTNDLCLAFNIDPLLNVCVVAGLGDILGGGNGNGNGLDLLNLGLFLNLL